MRKRLQKPQRLRVHLKRPEEEMGETGCVGVQEASCH